MQRRRKAPSPHDVRLVAICALWTCCGAVAASAAGSGHHSGVLPLSDVRRQRVTTTESSSGDSDGETDRLVEPLLFTNEFIFELPEEDEVDTGGADDALRLLNASWHGQAKLLSHLRIEGVGRLLHVRHVGLSERQRRSAPGDATSSAAAAAATRTAQQPWRRVVQQLVLTREKRSAVMPMLQPPHAASNRISSSSSSSSSSSRGRGGRVGAAATFAATSDRTAAVAESRWPRPIIYDKQLELPELRYYENKDVFLRFQGDAAASGAGLNSPSLPYGQSLPFNDPFLKDQWYLINRGQAGGPKGHDLNVLPVWNQGITGRGVVVSILDDGVQHSHHDLRRNYDAEASADLNDDTDDDPTPNEKNLSENSHGTRCAGEVAAEADNGVCGVGVAFNARIGGIRMLDGVVTDATEARALLHNNQYIDIYSASWGPKDDGETMEGPGVYCKAALREGVSKGRGGLGSIFVWATGNGGYKGDDCNADGYVSSPYTLSVGSINNYGQSTYFMESCPSTLAVVFTGGAHDRDSTLVGATTGASEEERPVLKVVTTDVGNRCTLNFQGTSSAAPLAAGCVALTLEANPLLSWRDVQHIVVRTAKIPNPDEPGWTINGAGLHVNDLFGFGVMDCGKMVELAQKWPGVGPQHVCFDKGPSLSSPTPILRGQAVRLRHTTDACQKVAALRIDELEHVEMAVRIVHPARGRLKLLLTSPAGTRSEMLSFRPNDHSTAGIDFSFMTVHSWGEDARGTWLLDVVDGSSSSTSSSAASSRSSSSSVAGDVVGYVTHWSLTFYGTSRLSSPPSSGDKATKAFEPGNRRLQLIMDAEQQSSEAVHIRAGKQQIDDTAAAGVMRTGADAQSSSRSSLSVEDEPSYSLDSEFRARLQHLLDHADPDFVESLLSELRQGLAVAAAHSPSSQNPLPSRQVAARLQASLQASGPDTSEARASAAVHSDGSLNIMK